jgi:hypothetical protein
LSVLREAHLGLVHEVIEARLRGDSAAATYVKRFAGRSPNLLRAVTDAVCVAYGRGCRRELVGVGEAAASAFAAVVSESGIERKAASLNAQAYLGPVAVSPYLDNRARLALDMISSERYTAALEGEHVTEALWSVGSAFVALDASGWTYWDKEGERTGFVPHAAGVAPVVHVTAVDASHDPWLTTRGDGLCDATLDVAALVATMHHARQVASTKQLVVIGPVDKLVGGQILGHPTAPIFFNADKNEIHTEIHDRTVEARPWLETISAVIAMAVSAEGLPPGSVTGVASNADWGNLAINIEGSRLGAIRDKQVPHLKHAEMQLWPLVVDVIRGSVHRFARVLPPGDEVREALAVEFPDLSTAKDLKDRLAAFEAGLPHGLTSAVEFMMASRPELSRVEAQRIIDGNLETYAQRNEFLASRNAPADASKTGATLAELQGAVGGVASGEARRTTQENPTP